MREGGRGSKGRRERGEHKTFAISLTSSAEILSCRLAFSADMSSTI